MAPVEPRNAASPNEKTPPSDATSRYATSVRPTSWAAVAKLGVSDVVALANEGTATDRTATAVNSRRFDAIRHPPPLGRSAIQSTGVSTRRKWPVRGVRNLVKTPFVA